MPPGHSPLGATLLKFLVPAVTIAVVLAASGIFARRRGLAWKTYFGFTLPQPRSAVFWIAASLTWMLASNYLWDWRGPWDFTVWRRAPLLIDALRVFAVAILGPIGEELLFRGFLYARLAHTHLGVRGSIILLGIGWALLHVHYSATVILILIAYGTLLGFARYRSGSVVVPILMHITWNLYAIW